MVTLPGIIIQDQIYESANSLVYRGVRADGLAVVVRLLKQDYPSPPENYPHPQFSPQSAGISTTAETLCSRSNIAFELVAVMKASQAISSEIELEQLLKSLMQLLIENAGAQAGCLILENSGVWAIEAACELNEGEQVCMTQVLQSIPRVNCLPESMIQYAIRTHESVILNDATREGNFTHDPYIQHNQTQSIFCLLLLNQSQLVGVLYLRILWSDYGHQRPQAGRSRFNFGRTQPNGQGNSRHARSSLCRNSRPGRRCDPGDHRWPGGNRGTFGTH